MRFIDRMNTMTGNAKPPKRSMKSPKSAEAKAAEPAQIARQDSMAGIRRVMTDVVASLHNGEPEAPRRIKELALKTQSADAAAVPDMVKNLLNAAGRDLRHSISVWDGAVFPFREDGLDKRTPERIRRTHGVHFVDDEEGWGYLTQERQSLFTSLEAAWVRHQEVLNAR